MSKSLPVVNVATQNFPGMFDVINGLVNLANTEVITANSSGAYTNGAGFVNGSFGSNTLLASVLAGGNLTATANLVISTNAWMNATTLSVGNTMANSFVNGTSISTSALFAQTLELGNSTVNAAINSTSFAIDSVVANQGGVYVGANVVLTPASLAVGNTVANSTAVVTANLAANAGVLNLLLTVGNSTVNTQINATSLTVNAVSSTSETVASLVTVGNSTIYSTTNSTAVSSKSLLASNNLSVGNSVVNSTAVSTSNLVANTLALGTTTANSTAVAVGNATVSGSGISVGNATVNSSLTATALTIGTTVANSTAISVASLGSNTISANVFTVGNVSVNTTAVAAPLVSGNALSVNAATVASTLAIGNVSANTTALTAPFLYFTNAVGSVLSVGNSTVNSVINATSISTTSLVANAETLASLLTVGNSVVNTQITPVAVLVSNVVSSGFIQANCGAYSGNLSIIGNLQIQGSLTYANSFSGDLIPNANGLNLGNTSTRWNLYAINESISGVQTIGANNDVAIRATSTVTTGAVAQVIDTFASSTYRTAKYLVQVTDNVANNKQVSELLIIHDNATVSVEEYAIAVTNTYLGQFSAAISGAVLNLSFTPTSTNTTVRMHRTLLAI